MRWLGISALVALAGLCALNGCTQIQTHDSLAELLKGREATTSTTKSEQDANAVPRENASAKLLSDVIQVDDVLTIQVVRIRTLVSDFSSSPSELISGAFCVRPDGMVDLNTWGSVSVIGLTPAQASDAVRKHLAMHSPVVALDERGIVVVLDFQGTGKRYYVVVEDSDKIERVHAFSLKGTETVLDAISSVDGLKDVAGKREIHLERRTTKPTKPWETLPVDWGAIMRGANVSTNYFLQADDRVYVTHKFPG